jgi:hypothetical protein
MTETVVGLFADPWSRQRDVGANARSLGALYRRAIAYRANPRPRETMRALFQEHWPEGQFVDIDHESAWVDTLGGADQIVLLYPDSIGLGFGSIERTVLQRHAPYATIAVLNGRRRQFVLSRGMRLRIRVRRLLERTMLPELALAIPLFLLATPFLLVFDVMRGRR